MAFAGGRPHTGVSPTASAPYIDDHAPEQYVKGFGPESLEVEDGGEVQEEWAQLDQDGCLPPQYLVP